jgi:ADP-ribose pyrophosphatase YjhB (NUDIX family)
MKSLTSQPRDKTDWPPRIVACAGAVVLAENRVLFVRQARGHALEGQWSIPWGIIDSEEAPEVAALRETMEESGICAEIKGLLGIQNLPQAGWLGIIFLCRHLTGTPASDGGIETDQAAYLNLAEMDALNEPFEPWCQWLARRVLHGDYHLVAAEAVNPYYPRLAFL